MPEVTCVSFISKFRSALISAMQTQVVSIKYLIFHAYISKITYPNQPA